MPLPIKEQDENNECFLIHEIARQVRTSFDRRALHLGLTRTQWHALSVLRRNPGIRQSQLAEMMEVEPITLVRLLDRMEKAGWIERQSDPEDRRANKLYLTEKVKKIIERMRAIAVGVRRDALEGFSEKEHEMLLVYLRKMKNNVAHMLSDEDDIEAHHES